MAKSNPHLMKGMSIVDKCFLNIFPEPNTGCWLWGGYANAQGYGIVYKGRASFLVHRVMYEHENNMIIPKGLFACHKCNNPYCSNPDHIYIGTQKQNMRQAYNEGRMKERAKAIPVAMLNSDGKIIGIYESLMDAQRKTGVLQSVISLNLRRKNKRKCKHYFTPLSEIDETELIKERENQLQEK